jgi:rubrerythrin
MSDANSEGKSRSPKLRKLLTALEGNWQTEMSGYYTYRTLAERDADPIRKSTLQHMADAELEHAALWGRRIEELGGTTPRYRGKQTGDADTLANRLGGQRMALRRLEIDESRAIAMYGQQLKDLDDEPSVAILRKVIEEEREHYIELSSLIRDRYPRRAQEALSTPSPASPVRLSATANTCFWLASPA